ncbi:MAG: zf-TFIIB domain-containing protein [Bdellovibrionaceae bacterium]|nr:zf-TFIIB domain-containing protein [Pseudobdellovibrionaceae bacterium]
MKCPKCASAQFKSFDTSENIEVEFCGACGAIWFESGELSEMVDTPKDMPFLKQSLSFARPTKLNCVTCDGVKLVDIPYHPEEKVRVDYCRECHGLLLDRKEVPAIEEINSRRNLSKSLTQVLEELKKQGFIRIR